MKSLRPWHIGLAGALTAPALLLVTPGDMLHFFGAFLICAAAILGIIAMLVMMIFRREMRHDGMGWIGAMVAIIGAHIVAFEIGPEIAMTQVRPARKYCEALIPLIDSIHAATGRYPDRIEPLLPPDAELPRLLARAYDTTDDLTPINDSFYHTDTAAYYFIVPTPSYFGADCWRWDSHGREWYLDD